MKILWYHFHFSPLFFLSSTHVPHFFLLLFSFFFSLIFSPPHTYPYTFLFSLLSSFYPYHFLQTPEHSSSLSSFFFFLALCLQHPCNSSPWSSWFFSFFSKFNYLQTGWFRSGRVARDDSFYFSLNSTSLLLHCMGVDLFARDDSYVDFRSSEGLHRMILFFFSKFNFFSKPP